MLQSFLYLLIGTEIGNCQQWKVVFLGFSKYSNFDLWQEGYFKLAAWFIQWNCSRTSQLHGVALHCIIYQTFPWNCGSVQSRQLYFPLIFNKNWVIVMKTATCSIICAVHRSLFWSHSLSFCHFLQHLRHLKYLITLFIYIRISIQILVCCEAT